jgi:allophanate hydrolase subunit 2
MAGAGGTFEVQGTAAILALTGAPMRAEIDGKPIRWNITFGLAPGEKLKIGPAVAGTYGYLHVAGGLDVPKFMGGRSTHLAAGIGRALAAGDALPVGSGQAAPGLTIDVAGRFSGGTIRVLEGPQSKMFSDEVRLRFAATSFARDPRGNRMGVQLAMDGPPFDAEGGLSVVSETIVPGDIQMTGAGTPFVLGPECQTTGGYPRLATVIPSDLPKMLQAAPGASIRFEFVTRDQALAAWRQEVTERQALAPRPLIRDPHDISDLLGYQLIDGVTAGEDET